MTTISKTEDRKLQFAGMQEGFAIIIEQNVYPSGAQSTNMMALSPDELRKILALAERSPK